MPTYTIHQTHAEPPLNADWDDPTWAGAETLAITHFRLEGSDHRPATQARLLYDGQAIHGIYRVNDHYVRCIHTEHNDPVCTDSTVEFFVQPHPDRGYLNFEFNCGGALLLYHITDHQRIGDGFAAYTKTPAADGAQVLRRTSLPPIIDPEQVGPTAWTVQFRIPFALIDKYTGPLGDISGAHWRANFYKCGDRTSHPHWGSWSPVVKFDFHQPACFGDIIFEPGS